MKPIYQCDWCGKRDTEEEIRCHEPLCSYNKELRSCLTCKNQKGLFNIECAAGVITEKGQYIQSCSLWEDDGKDRTKPAGFGDILGNVFGG